MLIVECGQNHCGNMDLAKRLICLAKQNGGDLVKFQLYNHKSLYRDNPNIPDVALSFDQAKMLFEYGQSIGIEVFFSVFDVERVKWCEEIGVKRYKIASTLNDTPTTQAVINTGKPIIMSLRGYEPYISSGVDNHRHLISFLYCRGEYPALPQHLYFEKVSFSLFAGFSDHTIGLDAAKIALARGAKIIERHFAIDHQTGVDAEWSMTPDELRELKRFETICKEVL